MLEAGQVKDVFGGTVKSDGIALSAGLFAAADTVLGPLYFIGAVGDHDQIAIYMALGISF